MFLKISINVGKNHIPKGGAFCFRDVNTLEVHCEALESIISSMPVSIDDTIFPASIKLISSAFELQNLLGQVLGERI